MFDGLVKLRFNILAIIPNGMFDAITTLDHPACRGPLWWKNHMFALLQLNIQYLR